MAEDNCLALLSVVELNIKVDLEPVLEAVAEFGLREVLLAVLSNPLDELLLERAVYIKCSGLGGEDSQGKRLHYWKNYY